MASRISKKERVIRTAVTLLLAAFALALAPTAPIAAIMAGLFAVAVGAMTITGWCAAPTCEVPMDAETDDEPTMTTATTDDDTTVTVTDTVREGPSQAPASTTVVPPDLH